MYREALLCGTPTIVYHEELTDLVAFGKPVKELVPREETCREEIGDILCDYNGNVLAVRRRKQCGRITLVSAGVERVHLGEPVAPMSDNLFHLKAIMALKGKITQADIDWVHLHNEQEKCEAQRMLEGVVHGRVE